MSKESYKAFGRGTPAGNAVYNLYNGKKSMDSTLDPDLLARLQKLRKEREEAERTATKVKVVPKSQAYVNVPKPTGGRKPPSAEQVAEWRLQALGRRKRLDAIMEETDGYATSATRDVPQYDRPARTDGDKTRLQQIMAHGEVLPPIQKLPKVLENRINRQKTRRVLLNEQFDAVAEELADKRRALRDVQSRQQNAVVAKTRAEMAGAGGLGSDEGGGGAAPASVSNTVVAALRAEETQLLRDVGQLVADLKAVDRQLCEIPEDED